MNRIVNAAVARHKAAKHLAICRIDNSVTTQRCNIPLPKVNSFLNRIQICKIGDSPAPYFFLKIGILYVEEFLSGILRHPKIKQCTEQIFCPCSSKGILISIYSGCSFCSCLIKYNRLCVCVIFHSSRITACCGQISKQFPQCRQCSCRIIAGMEGTAPDESLSAPHTVQVGASIREIEPTAKYLRK